MKWLVLVLLFGCDSGECVVVDAVIVSGTGELNAAPVASVLWAEASAPTVTNSVSFDILFKTGQTIECKWIPWAAVSHAVPVDVSENCVVIDADATTAPLANATISMTSRLDAANDGTISLRFDAPSQDVTFVRAYPKTVSVGIDALVADVTFTHVACSSGSTWGIWDI